MKQYLELLQTIEEKGTYKPAAREGMPGTQSLFGYQFRHNLSDGFPLLTTKKIFWKGVVVELLWFLRGDTNIKFLIDNGVNIWNEDAYQYYLKQINKWNSRITDWQIEQGEKKLEPVNLEEFVWLIKNQDKGTTDKPIGWGGDGITGYMIGDCGYQYGRVWRKWNSIQYMKDSQSSIDGGGTGLESITIDQIKNLIRSLKNTPESRRHIVTAVDPTHDTDLALYWCHAMFQFNCRPIPLMQRIKICNSGNTYEGMCVHANMVANESEVNRQGVPKYYLDCQLYQRSADVVLGVPFNIASYALLTEILAKICNMVAGEFIHTFGDVHIYENHKEAVEEQLKRTPTNLPKLKLTNSNDVIWSDFSADDFNLLKIPDFDLINYHPQESIKAKLSTGLK